MAKVSVIIPIYNVEKYVGKCIESVLNQTLADIEIICVDDGSTDESGNIADRYGMKDSRIKVIHKRNTGYGHTVNLGMETANGKYIGIVESDDFIESQMYERLYEAAEKNDLDYLRAGYYRYSDLGGKVRADLPVCDYGIVYSEFENMNKLFSAKSIWAGLYKRSFLTDNGIRFLETPGASYQDTGFWFKVCMSAHRGMLIEDALVNYRIDNENSSVKSRQKVFCICDEIEECRRYFEESDFGKEDILPYIYIYMYSSYQWNCGRIDDSCIEEFIDKTSDAMKEACRTLQFHRDLVTLSEWENMNIWAQFPQLYCRKLLDDRILQHNAAAYAGMFKQYLLDGHIYIYGAGKVGRRLEEAIRKISPDCRAEFLVSDLTGNGNEALSINDSSVNKNLKIIIAVADAAVRLEMREKAVDVGFKDILVWDSHMGYMCRAADMIYESRE